MLINATYHKDRDEERHLMSFITFAWSSRAERWEQKGTRSCLRRYHASRGAERPRPEQESSTEGIVGTAAVLRVSRLGWGGGG